MNITHALKIKVEDVTASTGGFDIETNCQSVLYINTGEDKAKLFFNNNEVEFYEMQPGAILTIDVNGKSEMVNDKVKVFFESAKAPKLKILKQFKTIIR